MFIGDVGAGVWAPDVDLVDSRLLELLMVLFDFVDVYCQLFVSFANLGLHFIRALVGYVFDIARAVVSEALAQLGDLWLVVPRPAVAVLLAVGLAALRIH